MSNVWFISDTHFGHANMLKFSKRRGERWSQVGEMDRDLIANWNAAVKPSDTVYHLGDFWLGQSSPADIIKSLNGCINILPGNHDAGLIKMYRGLFNAVLVQPWPWRKTVVLSHAPLHPSCLGQKGWRLNVHGHIHERVIERSARMDSRYCNVCVEQTDFKPVHADEILDLMRKVGKL